jgi:hypothetical protein
MLTGQADPVGDVLWPELISVIVIVESAGMILAIRHPNLEKT